MHRSYLAALPVVVNLDGIERHRAKWNALGRFWYRLGEITSVWFASRLVADAQVIADYYRDKYGNDTTVIRYGHGGEGNRGLVKAKLDGDIYSIRGELKSEIFE